MFLSRFTDTDRTTAFFASVRGGATDMAILGERFGAKINRIALAQSLRIMMVVVIIPFALTFLNAHGADSYAQLTSMRLLLSNAGQLLIAMALAALSAWVLASLAGVALPTMVLATAPGGIAEMCITAKALQLGTPLVIAAHVTRVLMLLMTTAPLFRLAGRLRARHP